MRQKNTTPNKGRGFEVLRRGVDRLLWVVVEDLEHFRITQHRITGEFKAIEK